MNGSLTDLDVTARFKLVELCCASAWSDHDLKDSERAYIDNMIERLGFTADQAKIARAWLRIPICLSELDLSTVPPALRELFLEEVRTIIAVDGEVADEESLFYEQVRRALFPAE